VSAASSRSSTATIGGANLSPNAMDSSTIRRTTLGSSAFGLARYSVRNELASRAADVDVSLVGPSDAGAVMDGYVGAAMVNTRVVLDAALEGREDSDALVLASSSHRAVVAREGWETIQVTLRSITVQSPERSTWVSPPRSSPRC